MSWNDIKKAEEVAPVVKASTGRYNVTRVEYGWHNFDSMSERDRYIELLKIQASGAISELEHHRVYLLMEWGEYRGEKIRAINYEADFVYQENGETVVEDVKSTHTVKDAQYILKKKMFKLRYPELLFREYIAVER